MVRTTSSSSSIFTGNAYEGTSNVVSNGAPSGLLNTNVISGPVNLDMGDGMIFKFDDSLELSTLLEDSKNLSVSYNDNDSISEIISYQLIKESHYMNNPISQSLPLTDLIRSFNEINRFIM